VSKGEFAKAKDLQKIFGTKDEEEIARLILTKGQVQVSDKERNQQLEKTNAQIAEWISKNCVQPSTDRPYTISQIRHAMQQANFSVHPTKPLKRQFLDCLKLLQEVIPIQRAKMELLLIVPDNDDAINAVQSAMKEHDVQYENEAKKEETGKNLQYKLVVDPSFYRVLNEVVETLAGAHIEIITQVVAGQGDAHLEADMELLPQILDDLEISPTHRGSPGKADGLDEDELSEHDVVEGSDEEEEAVDSNRRRQQQKKKKKQLKSQRRVDPEARVVMSDSSADPGHEAAASSAVPTVNQSVGRDAGGEADCRKQCNTCGGSFETAAAYRTHFKSDWHRFNQKLKMKGAAPISEEEFKLCDATTFFQEISADAIL
jgi:ribosome maturation protein SDO1